MDEIWWEWALGASLKEKQSPPHKQGVGEACRKQRFCPGPCWGQGAGGSERCPAGSLSGRPNSLPLPWLFLFGAGRRSLLAPETQGWVCHTPTDVSGSFYIPKGKQRSWAHTIMVLNGKLGRASEDFKAGFVKKAEDSWIDWPLWYWIPVLTQWQHMWQINQSFGHKQNT